MKIELNRDLESLAAESAVAFTNAKKNLYDAKAYLNADVARRLVAANLGRNAMVKHKHSAAEFGIRTDKDVISRVVNGWYSNGRVMLRIQLGKVSGGLSANYAEVPLEACELVSGTSEPY